MDSQTVYGIMSNRHQTENTIQDLVDSGINLQDISILSLHGEEFKDIKKGEPIRNWRTENRVPSYPKETLNNLRERSTRDIKVENHTKAPEGATAGGVTGSLIGGTLGLLAGIGALAIPGLGALIAAGPLLATLSGMGAGGTLGGIIGALVGSGVPEIEAEHLQTRLKEGGVLLSVRVNTPELVKRCQDILKRNGAEGVNVTHQMVTHPKRG